MSDFYNQQIKAGLENEITQLREEIARLKLQLKTANATIAHLKEAEHYHE